MIRRFALSLIILVCGSTLAQSKGLDAPNVVYVDSVKAGPGQDVPIGVYIKNDQPISALTIPLVYDPALLTIKTVDFTGSRAAHWQFQEVSPTNLDSANGHFLVGFVKIFEDPIPAGDGLAFTVLFTVSDTITTRELAVIDSLFYPPGGELIYTAADAMSTIVRPEFVAGKIFVDAVNESPSIKSVADQYLFEGEEFTLNIQATDPNGDKIRIVTTDRPRGSQFIDNGDGTGQFVWQPPYVGPGSSDGKSTTVSFWASDGDLSSRHEVSLNVLNTNRPPQILVVDSAEIDAGDSLVLSVVASDPDYEAVSWQFDGLPASADFSKSDPTRFVWPSTVLDDGIHELVFVASDPHGTADTAFVTVTVKAIDLYTLSFDTLGAFPNADIEVDVYLNNELPINELNLLIHYDQTVMQLTGVEKLGTRSSGFDRFDYGDDDGGVSGNLRILGVSDTSQTGPYLAAGFGKIVRLKFHIHNNPTLGGTSSPISFTFVDSSNFNDNTFMDPDGIKIEQSEIVYNDTYLFVLEVGSIKIGDINLNGIAYEVGDAIYFSNFFMDPINFPFNVVQFANSDINNDGIAASIADLIALINIVVNGGATGKVGTDQPVSAIVEAESTSSGIELRYETDFEIGGMLMKFESDRELSEIDLFTPHDDMKIYFHQDGSEVRLLLFSMEGHSMPQGRGYFLEIEGVDDIAILSVDLATSAGQLVSVELANKDVGLPESFALHQNYPNPFNPETNISFNLDRSQRVRLEIYNVLGRNVVTLIDEVLPAGSHTVVWDGNDNHSQSAASGVYFYRLSSDEESLTRKMMLIK